MSQLLANEYGSQDQILSNNIGESKGIYVKTYGCQMNVYDSKRMIGIMSPLGYKEVDSFENADLVILNTCHIRENAECKVFSELGRIRPYQDKKRNNGGRMLVAVAGCVAQAQGAEIMRKMPFVDMVFGPQTYHCLPEMVAKALHKSGHVLNVDFPVEDKFDHLPDIKSDGGCSAFLTVQEGCDKFCTFCVVPYTRGAEFSRPVAQIISEARCLVSQGVCEITLLGQNVNAYHGEAIDGSTWSLARLILELAEINGLKRIRYVTSHPRDMADDLIDAHGHCKEMMPYLHLPVQSGSNKVLAAMNRQHTRDHYFRIIDKLREKCPDLALSGDFIVGFPGETDEDFEDTMDLVRRVQYSQAYSFKYSARPGTPAANLRMRVDPDVANLRLQDLQTLLSEQQSSFNSSMLEKTLPVLLERPGRFEGQVVGRTPYMQAVNVEDSLAQNLGKIVPVYISDLNRYSLKGSIVDNYVNLRNPCEDSLQV